MIVYLVYCLLLEFGYDSPIRSSPLSSHSTVYVSIISSVPCAVLVTAEDDDNTIARMAVMVNRGKRKGNFIVAFKFFEKQKTCLIF